MNTDYTDLLTTRDLGSVASVTYPHKALLKLGLGSSTVTVPDSVVKGVFLLGVVSLAYHAKDICKLSYSLATGAYKSVRCLFKELKTEGTAVIYGANTGIGRAFAKKFVEAKATVILVDFEADDLKKMKEEFMSENGAYGEQVICCALGRAGSVVDRSVLKELNEVIKKQKEISYFVNCMSAKPREVVEYHQGKTGDMVQMSYSLTTVYAILLKKVLKRMCEASAGQVVHLNTAHGNKELKKTHPLFLASLAFAVHLTKLLQKVYKKKGVSFMNINAKYCKLLKMEDYTSTVHTCLLKSGLFSNIYL